MNIFKSLEIDVEKGIYKLNGEDLKQCQEIAITIKPEKAEVLAVTTKDIFYETLDIKRWPHLYAITVKNYGLTILKGMISLWNSINLKSSKMKPEQK